MPFEKSVLVPLSADETFALITEPDRLRRWQAITALGKVGSSELPAASALGILSVEFLVHAWDFARATGQQLTVPDALTEHVLGVAHAIITPEVRTGGSFAEEVPTGPDAGLLDRLIAFTGHAA